MSWNKNTVVFSGVDQAVRVLQRTGTPYVLHTLGEVPGFGLNDEDTKKYPIRRLEYGSVVLLEKIVRTCDCDSDDDLISIEFPKEMAPLDSEWEVETKECICGFDCSNQQEDGDEECA